MNENQEITDDIDRIKASTDKEDADLKKMLLDAAVIIRSAVDLWREKQSNAEEAWTHRCRQCGRRCRLAKQLLQSDATPQDLARWIQEKRYDILSFVGPIIDPDSEDAMFDIWVDQKTHDYVKKCPWLRKKKDGKKYICAIHDLKPEVCRDFPTNKKHGKDFGCPECGGKLPERLTRKQIR